MAKQIHAAYLTLGSNVYAHFCLAFQNGVDPSYE